MFTYDFLITAGSEVEMIWKRTLTTASAIFVLNRYSMLVYLVSHMLPVNTTMDAEVRCSIPHQSQPG